MTEQQYKQAKKIFNYDCEGQVSIDEWLDSLTTESSDSDVIYNVKGSVHTMKADSDDITINEEDKALLDNKVIRTYKRRVGDEYKSSTIFNPNEFVGADELEHYSEVECVCSELESRFDMANFEVTRVDMRFDMYEKGDFSKFEKLHRFMLLMLAEAYPEGNSYNTRELKYLDIIKSNKVVNKRFEAENYDKEIESKGKDKTTNRLELRSKDLKGKSIPDEFMTTWFKRWNKALKEYDRVQSDINTYLVNQWKEIENDIAKGNPSDYSSPYAFYEAKKDMIYTSNQFLDLIMRCEDVDKTKALNKSKYIRKRVRFNFIKRSDINVALNGIREATNTFFS